MSKIIADAMHSTLVSPNESDRNGEAANVADGLFAIARAIDGLALQLKYLGNGDASTPMGAIEAFGKHIGERMDYMTDAITGAISDTGGDHA